MTSFNEDSFDTEIIDSISKLYEETSDISSFEDGVFYSAGGSADESTFGIIDAVKGLFVKGFNSYIKRTDCSLDLIGNIVGEGEFKNEYKKYRVDVEKILNGEAKQCVHVNPQTEWPKKIK